MKDNLKISVIINSHGEPYSKEELIRKLYKLYNDLIYDGHLEHIEGYLPEWLHKNIN